MNFLKMRKVIFSTFLLLMFAVSTVCAMPYWDGQVWMEGAWTMPVDNVRSFDWAQSGSGMAIGIQPGQELNIGDTFTFTYQAFLVDLMNKDGNSSGVFPLLNDKVNLGGYEYTFVSKITEEIIDFQQSVIPGGFLQTAIFKATGGDGFYYYDDSPDADVANGTGFDDGIQVLTANIADGYSTFTYNTVTGEGGGGTAPHINWTLEPLWVNDEYIRPTENPDLCDMHFGATLNYPPGNSDTLNFFAGGSAVNYATIPVTGDDMLFKVDGYSTLTVVPEPCTMLLLGSGLIGAAGFARRRKKKSGSLEA